MNCSPDLLDAYFDEELDTAQQIAVKQHLETCPACSEAYARLRKQRESIKAVGPYYNAPPELSRSIRDKLHRLAEKEIRTAPQVGWRWLAVAASLLLGASVSWNIIQLRTRDAGADLAESVLADHIRSLIGAHLVDVPSSDRHTVKPWFAGKLDFSPNVPDLEAQGFPLVGGRVDYLGGRRVAALVYHRRQHVINLFIWPGEQSSGKDASTSRNGYNLLRWTAGSMTYWAVSDVSAGELEHFRDFFR